MLDSLQLLKLVLFPTLAGLCIPLGALLARREQILPNWLDQELRHFVIALGGGVLLAAVALVLIPEGSAYLDAPPLASLYMLLGGTCFFALERFLGHQRREAPQLSAMLLDYVPECLALGGMFAAHAPSATLLALLIGLQNLPEGFNAYRELTVVNGNTPRKTLRLMWAMVPLGPLLALSGWFYFSAHRDILGAVMLFAAGGILYLIFQDIAPQSRLRRHWGPPLGAVLGFSLALFGQSLLHGAG